MSRQKVIYKDGEKVYLIDRKEVSKEEFFENSKLQEIIDTGEVPGGMPTNGYPFYSYAAGVGAENAKEAAEICRKSGHPTDFNADGEPKFTSQEHRRKFCKTFGLYDRNAGYGDQAPTCKASTQPKKKGTLPDSVTKQFNKGKK